VSVTEGRYLWDAIEMLLTFFFVHTGILNLVGFYKNDSFYGWENLVVLAVEIVK